MRGKIINEVEKQGDKDECGTKLGGKSTISQNKGSQLFWRQEGKRENNKLQRGPVIDR